MLLVQQYLNSEIATILKIFFQIVNSFFAVVWVIAIAFLAYGGLLFITSAGDKNKAEAAKGALTNALIGIAIILSINVIVSLIGNIFGGSQTVTPSIGATIPTP